MTADAQGKTDVQAKKISPGPEIFVPILAFGSTIAGVMLHTSGVEFEIQYAAVGGFLASCLLAYLAWTRLHKDIVALSTPIYGFIFLVTPIDYAGGVALQLVYAAGLTILAARLRYRFGTGIAGGTPSKDLSEGPLRTYVESGGPLLSSLDPACGSASAEVFLAFSAGEYARAAEIAHAGICLDTQRPDGLVRAFSVLRQHAELMENNEPRPLTYQKFLPADAGLLARHLAGSGDPEREFELMLDNALLLLFSAGWHASPRHRPVLLASQGFARKLIGE